MAMEQEHRDLLHFSPLAFLPILNYVNLVCETFDGINSAHSYCVTLPFVPIIEISLTKKLPLNPCNMTLSPHLQSGGELYDAAPSILIVRVLKLLQPSPSQLEHLSVLQVHVRSRLPSLLNVATCLMHCSPLRFIFNQDVPSEPATVLDDVSRFKSIACAAVCIGSSSLKVWECSALAGCISFGFLTLRAEIVKHQRQNYFPWLLWYRWLRLRSCCFQIEAIYHDHISFSYHLYSFQNYNVYFVHIYCHHWINLEI